MRFGGDGLSTEDRFATHRAEIVSRQDEAHEAFYVSGVFGGPSLYFHEQALAASAAGEVDRFAECVYAVLTSWGMHRMGANGPKMRDFPEFRATLQAQWPRIQALRKYTPNTLTDDAWLELGAAFRGLKCMASGTSIVGNSKVLAHALPDLIPPIDREYTLYYLLNNKSVANDVVKEWDTASSLLKEFFYPLLRTAPLDQKINQWVGDVATFRWDTSPLKVLDNLLIGTARLRKGSAPHSGKRRAKGKSAVAAI